MGDRVSIQFKTGGEKSVVLFSHWGGIEFVNFANDYAKELLAETGEKHCMPLDRLEPHTVMVDFIRYLSKDLGPDKRIESNYYIGTDEDDGDNSDNGHFIIEFVKPAEGVISGVYVHHDNMIFNLIS